MIVTFAAEVWEWDARRSDSWAFVSLPVEASDDIRERAETPRRGFGAVRVRVTLGGTTWSTSVFPDKASGRYVLPVKQAVRAAEAIEIGQVATVTVEVVGV